MEKLSTVLTIFKKKEWEEDKEKASEKNYFLLARKLFGSAAYNFYTLALASFNAVISRGTTSA
jgi:hypothetical protein